jgi:hypothetical protein
LFLYLTKWRRCNTDVLVVSIPTVTRAVVVMEKEIRKKRFKISIQTFKLCINLINELIKTVVKLL